MSSNIHACTKPVRVGTHIRNQKKKNEKTSQKGRNCSFFFKKMLFSHVSNRILTRRSWKYYIEIYVATLTFKSKWTSHSRLHMMFVSFDVKIFLCLWSVRWRSWMNEWMRRSCKWHRDMGVNITLYYHLIYECVSHIYTGFHCWSNVSFPFCVLIFTT